MATSYKVLGQTTSSAYNYFTIYTVPAGVNAVISTITICNQNYLSSSYSLAVQKNGDFSNPPQQYQFIAREITVGPTDSTTATLGITLAAGDSIVIWAANNDVSFNVFGSEIS